VQVQLQWSQLGLGTLLVLIGFFLGLLSIVQSFMTESHTNPLVRILLLGILHIHGTQLIYFLKEELDSIFIAIF
jgi:hypothetical protein